jgi:hypothetical protein
LHFHFLQWLIEQISILFFKKQFFYNNNVLSAKDLTSDITLFAALYFEVYLYVYDGIGDFDEVAISLKELKETQKRIEKNNKALGILTKKIIESIE